MRAIISLITAFTFILCLGACGAVETTPENSSTPSDTAPKQPTHKSTEFSGLGGPEDNVKSNALVVYFSCTGNTKAVAEKIAGLTGADVYEIVPEDPYTEADLNYNNSDCRANCEQNDESVRPAIGSDTIDLSSYDTVILGYPIWWGTMPRIINTFLDTYDLSGKTVLPFCTSGGSGVSKSVSDIKTAVPSAQVKDGLRASDASGSAISLWLSDNGF